MVDNLKTYCRQDVRLMHSGLKVFHQQNMAEFGGLNMLSSITISALANRILRDFYLPKFSKLLPFFTPAY